MKTKKNQTKNWILAKSNSSQGYVSISKTKRDYKNGWWQLIEKTKEEIELECKEFTILDTDNNPLPFLLKITNRYSRNFVVDLTTGQIFNIRTRDLLSYVSNNIVPYGIFEGLFTFVKQGSYKLCLKKIKDLE